MNKVIDINEFSTYPIELVNFCNEKKETLINSLKDNYLYLESNLYSFVDSMLKDYEFKCIHVSNIYDVDSIKKYGILRPIVVQNDRTYEISSKFKRIILGPLKSLLSENNFNEVLKRYDKHLIESIEYIEMVPDYFGKHSVIFYSMDSMNQVNLKRDSNYQLIDRYGGELIENCIDEEILKQCSKAGTPVVISFKLHSYELKKLNEIYLYMIYKIIGKEYQFMNESYINKDIPPCDIIEVKEIDKL